MKKYVRKIFFSGMLLLLLSACELDRIPETELSEGVFYTSSTDFQTAVNYGYKRYSQSYGNYLIQEQITDHVYGRVANEISSGTYIPTPNFGNWNFDYTTIRHLNNILEKAAESDLPPEIIRRWVAEARFFRALFYYKLVKRYGDVPLILRTLEIDDPGLFEPRTSRDIVIDQIYDDLDFAAENLPLQSDIPTSEWSRTSRGAVLTLKSRVALFEGTFNKFHAGGLGDAGKATYHLQIARDAALAVIQSNEYDLFASAETPHKSYRRLFEEEGTEDPFNPESIWVMIYGFDDENRVNRKNIWTMIYTHGNYCFTRALVDKYLCVDGLPIDRSPSYEGRIYAGSEFVNRDPRLEQTIIKPGARYFEGRYEHREDPVFLPSMFTVSGYQMLKGCSDAWNMNNYMIMRYGEVLLNYAEATYELNDDISDADLDITINRLRDRPGVEVAHLSNAFVSDNGLNMRDEIRRERTVELANERFRYDDLIRWKTAEVEMPKAVEGVTFFDEDYPMDSPDDFNLRPDGTVIVQSADSRFFDPEKHYLWPIPLTQVALNPNLKQNPNW